MLHEAQNRRISVSQNQFDQIMWEISKQKFLQQLAVITFHSLQMKFDHFPQTAIGTIRVDRRDTDTVTNQQR